MMERVATFGDGGNLVGIVTEPAGGQGGGDLPAVIFLNTGTLHRIGPYRAAVDLAREFAVMGFLSMRFDLSGLGDSAPRQDNLPEGERAVADVCDAMDYLSSKWGAERFILWGICTGAVNSHRAAVADSRVCGVVSIDGYAYKTPRFFYNRYARFVFSPSDLSRVAKFYLVRLATRKSRKKAGARPYVGDEYFGWDLPPKRVLEGEFRTLVERGVRCLYVFSGDSQTRDRYNYGGQMRDAFRSLDFGDCMQDEFIRAADHIFSQLKARTELNEITRAWALRHFSS